MVTISNSNFHIYFWLSNLRMHTLAFYEPLSLTKQTMELLHYQYEHMGQAPHILFIHLDENDLNVRSSLSLYHKIVHDLWAIKISFPRVHIV